MIWVYKSLLIAAILIIIGLLIVLGVFQIKLTDALRITAEREAVIVHLNAQIAKAEISISNQNEAVEILKAEFVKNAEILKKDYSRISKKYELLLQQTRKEIGEKPECEVQLKAIHEAQKAFCYER